MKRGGSYYDGQPNKRIKPANEEIRLLIQSRSAGSVIGKGGQNISKLRSDYNASITVPDCPGPERVLTISADEESMMNVIHDVIPFLEEKRRGTAVGMPDKCELRVLIHQSQVGAVIGKGGARIKELREETGANVKIFSACCPESTDRVMQICGAPDVSVECLRKIVANLVETPINPPYEPYNPHYYDEEFAPEYGGFGEPGRRAARGTAAPWSGPWMSDGPPGRMGRGSMNGSGFGSSRGFGPGMGRGLVDNDFGGGRGGPPGRFGPGEHAGGMNRGNWVGGGGGRGRSNYELGFKKEDSDYGESKSQVTIPQNLAGAIIGKGGSRIRNIRAESGASIVIEDGVEGSRERVITITGTAEAIEMAQYLLQQSVRAHGSV